jgi:NAD(P)-dependent dehydrogenase (short-subunit alcohol dehydrogenase family)
MSSSRLDGRRALVTGSTGGIGVGIARSLSQAGAFVVVSGRDRRRGAGVVADLIADGGQAAFVQADLSQGQMAASALAKDAETAAGGEIDVLVNNAAMLIDPAPTAAVSESLMMQAFAVSVVAPFLLTGILAPPMAERRWGAVVNIGSINGLVGMSRSALYSATKAALHSLTKSWAAEFASSGVRINTVAPGPTATDFNREREALLAPIMARIPSGRMSTLEEVGAVVAFLASDAAVNIHGATLTVDGGFSIV